ncbi:MAG: UvrD-helicase domain-containing protein, partial [Bacteroidota bacterium]
MPNLTPYQLEALNHKKHISLTANAGSGKTFVLARRFLSILIQENIQLNNIVAITFTDKAAAELYKKIADELDNRIKESGDSEIVRKLERIRRQLVSAKISTIHSFCTDLLKEFSPEAGVDANFTPIDKNTTDELITTTIEEFISETIKNKSELFPDLKQIIHLFGSRNILSQHLKTLIGKRSIVIKLNENLYSKSEVEIEKYFSESFEKYFKEIFDNGISSVIKQIEKVNNLVLQNAKNIDFAEKVDEILNKPIKENIFEKIITLNKIFTIIITGKGTVRSQSYLSKKLREEVESTIEEIENFANEIRVFDFTDNYKETEHQLAKFGLSIINLWEEILLRYEQKKDHLGYLDFEDLLLVTQKLLERKDVIKYLAEQYQYFMIDE